jgi:hypothetical protein
MLVDLMFPNKYLKAADLEIRGGDVTLTVSNVTGEELQQVDGTSKTGWIVYFEETAARAKKDGVDEKRLVLNKTNAKSIAAHLGANTDDWIGQKVTLYSTKCMAFGKQQDCIRVR